MSARVENLTDRLAVLIAEIAAKESAGEPTDTLLQEKSRVEADLRQARSLLTEGSEAKVLRG